VSWVGCQVLGSQRGGGRGATRALGCLITCRSDCNLAGLRHTYGARITVSQLVELCDAHLRLANRLGPRTHSHLCCSTFGGMLAHSGKYALSMTARTSMWVAGTAGAGAALRELLHAGPRYGDMEPGKSPAYLLAGAAAGAACAQLLMADFDITRPRRLLYAGMAGAAGAYLPAFISLAGPVVRSSLGKYNLLPQSRGRSGGEG
jgi:hypothetical protein